MSTVPTILDLMVQTQSLNERDKNVALDLMNEYEGQTLVRPYRSQHNGRHVWHFGVINAGGTFLSVDDASLPYRLIIPLVEEKEFVFTNLAKDPYEESLLQDFSLGSLSKNVRYRFGHEAAQWVFDAEKVGRWWVNDRRRLYNYSEDEDEDDDSDSSWAYRP